MASQDKAARLLSRFPGPVMLYPSRRKWMLVALICALFVAASLWILSKGDPADTFMGWSSFGFFGAGLLVALSVMMPNSASLILKHDEFSFTTLFRRQPFRWTDCSNFAVARVSSQDMVVFDIASAKGTLAQINTGLTGRNSGLPDTYGLAAADLASLMNQWRERALRDGK